MSNAAPPAIPMEDWAVIKAEEPQKNSQSFLLLINEESVEPLRAVDYKLRFGIRHAKLKVFKSGSPVDEVEETGGLLDGMNLEGAESIQDDERTSD